MKFTPRPFQPLMVDHMLKHKRSAVWVFLGGGKTTACLSAIDTLNLIEPTRTLVLAPVRVARSVWPEEVKHFDDFKHLKTVPIVGDLHARRRALKQDADIHTINYELLPWLVHEVGAKWRWKNIVADEATRLKSFRLRKGSVRAKALATVAWKYVDRFVELTGTPSPNGLQDLWGQLWFLDQGKRLGSTYTAFLQRWFKLVACPGFTKNEGPYKWAVKEIEDRVKDICLSLNAADWFDLKEPVVVDVPVQLPDDAMVLYKQMEKEMFIEIGEHEIEAQFAANKSMKCLQLANGAIYLDENAKTWAEVHDVKLEALESIIEEAGGMPVLVAYHFKSDLARLKKRFPQASVMTADPKVIVDWNAGKIPVLLAHPDSAGHGLNLQHGGNIIVMFSHNWSLESFQQILERIGPMRQMQSGYDRPVFVYNIRAVDTIDEVVIERRKTKRSVQDLLLEAARRRS